ncbi:MAG: ATP-binding cassette domain-containing protein, partial [Bdellovibrionales bacterium]|nr:ATP-binding cassette domain-containing protein [Bdellovibrionales bacterium]
GAGKTTLLSLLNGSQQVTAGAVLVDGQRLDERRGAELRRLRSELAFVYQLLHLIPNLRVLQNVLMGRLGRLGFFSSLRLLLAPQKNVVEEVYQLLMRVGIAEKLYQPVSRLSGGEQQRVAIARALFQQPRALLTDEPVSSVDPARAHEVLELLTSLARERGVTLCMSIHQVELAQRFFPRLVGLRRGQVVFDGPPEDFTQAAYDSLYSLTEADPAAPTMLRDG